MQTICTNVQLDLIKLLQKTFHLSQITDCDKILLDGQMDRQTDTKMDSAVQNWA